MYYQTGKGASSSKVPFGKGYISSKEGQSLYNWAQKVESPFSIFFDQGFGRCLSKQNTTQLAHERPILSLQSCQFSP